MPDSPVIRVSGIRKTYGSTVAVDDVSFEVNQREIFVREPLGFVGTVAIPVVVFVILGRTMGRSAGPAAGTAGEFVRVGLPVLASILIALSA